MNDADQQRLDQIRAQLKRISGHKVLSPKQMESLKATSAAAQGSTST